MVIGGAGGQGILTLGRVLSYAGIDRNLEVSCLPAYGAEMRGGYVYCIIVFSGGNKVLSPVISKTDIGVFMNEKSFMMLSSYVKKGCCLFLNSSLVKKTTAGNKEIELFEISASETAEEIGSLKVANMIMAGAIVYLINEKFFPLRLENLLFGLKEVIKDKKLYGISEKAASIGWNLMRENTPTSVLPLEEEGVSATDKEPHIALPSR